MPKPTTVAAWQHYIQQQWPRSIDMTLERVVEVAERLDMLGPQPFQTVIVGGTNGKGSTCHYLESLWLNSGKRVAVYSSPHLRAFNERIRVNGCMVDDARLLSSFKQVECCRASVGLTYFEFTTLVAMSCIVQEEVDGCILEVGMGGRLDAVNIFAADATVITPIDLDHCDWLGPDRESIGSEKAGIFRSGVPVICSDPEPPQSLVTRAKRLGCSFYQIEQDFAMKGTPAGSYRLKLPQSGSAPTEFELPSVEGLGAYQHHHFATAATTAQLLGLALSPASLTTTWRDTRHPGRQQLLSTKPDVWLDVAHNAHAIDALAHRLKQSPIQGRTYALFTMLADKPVQLCVQQMVGLVYAWYIPQIQGERAPSSVAVAAGIQTLQPDAEIHLSASIEKAWQALTWVLKPHDRLVVFGSFVLAGAVLELLDTMPYPLMSAKRYTHSDV